MVEVTAMTPKRFDMSIRRTLRDIETAIPLRRAVPPGNINSFTLFSATSAKCQNSSAAVALAILVERFHRFQTLSTRSLNRSPINKSVTVPSNAGISSKLAETVVVSQTAGAYGQRHG
jgi:hypothetical protein